MNGDHKAGKFDGWCQTRIRQVPHDRVPWRRVNTHGWAPTLNDYRLWQFLLGTLRPIVTTHGRISSWVRRVSRGPSQPSTIPKLSRTKVHPVDPPLYFLGETAPVAMPSLASPSLRSYPYLTRGFRLHTSEEVVGTKPTYCSPGTYRLTFDVKMCTVATILVSSTDNDRAWSESG